MNIVPVKSLTLSQEIAELRKLGKEAREAKKAGASGEVLAATQKRYEAQVVKVTDKIFSASRKAP